MTGLMTPNAALCQMSLIRVVGPCVEGEATLVQIDREPGLMNHDCSRLLGWAQRDELLAHALWLAAKIAWTIQCLDTVPPPRPTGPWLPDWLGRVVERGCSDSRHQRCFLLAGLERRASRLQDGFGEQTSGNGRALFHAGTSSLGSTTGAGSLVWDGRGEWTFVSS
ncbi:hypothetical protein LZ30DRAFT_216143 [Colletotrichum cereale]|nr:hypothetical protein LZ30DRAFT_216143 [Colletotrichum cereale]